MKTMKKMMTLFAVLGLVLALAPAAQAATVIDFANATGTPTAWNAVGTPDRMTNDVFAALAYDPDAAPNTAQPIQGPGTAGTYLWAGDNAVDQWSADIVSIPGGEALAFLDVWGTTGGSGDGGYDRTRNIVITLTNSVNSTTWSSSQWNGVFYTDAPAGPNIQTAGPGFGRFDFTTAGVTDNLLTLATGLSIISNADATQIAEIRLVASVPPAPAGTVFMIK
jgi:hypothetical protein